MLTILSSPLFKKGYLSRALGVQPGYMIQSFRFTEASGTVAASVKKANNVGYIFGGGGISYRNAGPAGTYALGFDGNNTGVDMCDDPGNTFGADWNGNLYSAIVWCKVDGSARWTDSSTFRYGWHIRDGADTTYYCVMGRHTDNHKIFWRRRTGGPIVEQTYTFSPAGPLDWFCMGCAFDQSQPLLDFYLWTSALGFTKLTGSTSANLTDWGAKVPTNGTTLVGAGSLTLQEWIGYHGLTITWSGIKLSDAEMRKAMTPT